MKKMTLAAARSFAGHGRATRKAAFLTRMEGLLPWAEFRALIESHDSHDGPNLLHGGERRCGGDSACLGKARRERLKANAPNTKDLGTRGGYGNSPQTAANQATNQAANQATKHATNQATKRGTSSVRSRAEHPFLTFKRFRSVAQVRYRGVAKQANRALAMRVMRNINKWDAL